MYRFVVAKEEYIPAIVANISPDIKKELQLLRDCDVEETIRDCIVNADEAWVALNEEGIICLFGITRPSLLSEKGFPWLITTNLVKKHKKNLLKGARISIKYWLTKYESLENYIPVGLDRLLKWARWAGFTVYPAEAIGLKGKLVHRIEMRKE